MYARGGPEWIIWIVTAQCNLSCPYCYTTRYSGEKILSTKNSLRIIEEAASMGVSHINFTGGEPLLRRDIFVLMRAAIDRGIETSLFSNLTVLREYQARELARLGVRVLTSMDGDSSLYESIKGRGFWKKFLEGVQMLRKYGVELHINIPVSEINYRYVGDTIRKAISLGASSLSLIPAMPAGNAVTTNTYIKRESFIYALKEASSVARELGVLINVWCSPFLASLQWAGNVGFSNCRFWQVMDITPSGKVVFCDVLGIEVADVVRDGLRGAWEKLQSHQLNKLIMKIPAECNACPFKSECMGGCYSRAYWYWNKLPAPDPLCPLVRAGVRQVQRGTSGGLKRSKDTGGPAGI